VLHFDSICSVDSVPDTLTGQKRTRSQRGILPDTCAVYSPIRGPLSLTADYVGLS